MDGLHAACRDGNVDALTVALGRSNGDVDKRDGFGNTGLHWAAMFGQDKCIALLSRWGADMNSRDSWATNGHINTHKSGNTPLHHAVDQGHLSTAQLLISKGADRTLRNREGLTPSDIARNHNHGPLIDYFESLERPTEWGSGVGNPPP